MPPPYLHKLASNRMTTPKWKKKGIHDFQMEPKLSLGVIWWRIDVEFSLLSFSYLKKKFILSQAVGLCLHIQAGAIFPNPLPTTHP